MAMTQHIYLRILGYVITIVVHVTNVVVMMNSFHGEPMKNKYVRHFSEMQFFFFTCWTFSFQTVHAVVALFSDILTLMNSSNKKYKLPQIVVDCRDAMFTILVWPSSMLVFSIFWSFFIYDRNLFFPEDIDLVISKTSNHIMHSCIIPATIWEALLRPRKMPGQHKWRLLCVLLVEALYIAVIVGVYIFKGVWVYPIFGILIGSIYFYLFFLFVAALLTVIYFSQWGLNYLVWGSQENIKKLI